MKNISLFIILSAVSWLSVMETFAQSVPTLSTSVTNPSCGNASGFIYINQLYCNGCTITKWEKGILSSPVSAANPHGIFTPQTTLAPIANLPYSATVGQAPVAYKAYYRVTTNGVEYETFPLEIRADVQRSAGILSGSGTFFNVAPPVQLTLTGSSGTPQWLKSMDGANWVTTYLPSDNTVTVTQSTWFQVRITNGACADSYSNVAAIQIFKTALLSGPATVPEGDRVTLTLTPQQTQPQPVIQWEYSTDGGNTWVIFDYNSYGRTISNDAFADTHRITGTTLFRVMVDAGPGGHPYTNTISVAYLPYTRYYANQVKGGNYVREQHVTTPGITTPNAVEGATTQKHEVITYLDGVGRPLQQNVRKASANGQNDIISARVYDHQGRQTTQYLPYVSAGNDGAYRTEPLTEQWSFYSHGSDKMAYGPYPFAQTQYEKSPLGRIQAQGSVGPEFQLYSTHTQRVGYYGNAANEVRMFKADGSSTGFYPANELSKIETLDADQKKTQTFTDKAGKTILSRVQLDDNININGISVNVPWLETYYIYNTAGAIKYMISPKGVYILQSGGSWTLTPSILNQYIHQFTYDSFGRLIEKKVPGQAWVYYCYDRLDRLVLAQDGTTGTNKWLFIKYDGRGRAIMQGLYTNTTYTTRASLQSNVVDPLYALDTDLYYEERGAAAHGYTNQSFPTTGTQIQAVNYYDDYDLNNDGTATPDVAYTPQSLAGENTPTDITAGMPTASKRLVLDGGNTWLYRYAFYDRFGRVIQTVSNNHLSTAVDNITTMVYDFEGKVTLTKNYHNAGPGKKTTVVNTFVYDAGGRLKQVKQNNNNAGSDQLVAQYEYNELGQLVDKKLHSTDGTNFLQSIDYRYNLQGKLTSINNAQLTSDAQTNDDTNDMFGMELLYQTTEAGLTTASDVSYNGNISAVKWKGAGATAGAADQKSYKFAYDKSNKLTNATSQLNNGSMWAKEAGALNENLTYDHNGNILTLQRNQRKNLSLYTYIAEPIDNLTYNYNPALGDQLQKVTDAASGTAEAGFDNSASGSDNDYVYDVNGNLIKDLNKGISNIVYNHLGKPTTITFSDGRHADYVYDATGTKLTVKAYDTSNALKTTTDYVNGFVYENNTLSFFSSPEGRVVNNNGTLEYQYTITDQQGNTRVLFSSVNPTTPPITASFEDPTADTQKGFKNIPTDTRYWVPKSAANNTSSGRYVMRMNSTYSTGPAKSLSVFPGDVVNLEVWSYFEGSSGFGARNQSLNTLITSVAGAFGGVPGTGEAAQIYGHVSNAYNIFGSPTNAGDGAPTAHLNYILFDRDYNPLDMGWKAVPATANMSKQLVSFNPITIKEAGFIYVYLSYGGDGTNWVYFDDLKITHTKTNVIQYNEYYPYRMQASTSWTRDDNKNNLNTTGWYDLEFRNYDAAIGRFMQVDPLATKYASFSSYHYSFNNPVMFSDPSGAGPTDGAPTSRDNSYGGTDRFSDAYKPGYGPYQGPSDPGAGRMYGEFLLSERIANDAYQRSKDRENGTPIDPSQYATVLNAAKKGTLLIDNNGNWGYFETIHYVNSLENAGERTEYRQGSVGKSQTQGRSAALPGDIIDRIIATQSKDGSFTGSATALLQGDENAYIAGSTNAGMFNEPSDDVTKLFTQLKSMNKNGNTLRMSATGKASYELQLGRSINEMNSLLVKLTPSLLIIGIDASGIETSFVESRLKESIEALNTENINFAAAPTANNLVVDAILDNILKANQATGTLNFDEDDYKFPDREGPTVVGSFKEGGESHYVENINFNGAGSMDTRNPEISISEGNLIRVAFKNTNNRGMLFYLDVKTVRDLRALLRRIGADESKANDVVQKIVKAIKAELAEDAPNRDRITMLVNALDPEELKGEISDDEKIKALKTLVSGVDFDDANEENACIAVINSAKDEEIQDLHTKLQEGSPSLIKRLLNKHSDYNPYVSDENYTRLVQVLLDQFTKKIKAKPNAPISNKEEESIDYPDWNGRIKSTGNGTQSKFTATMDDNGVVTITEAKEELRSIRDVIDWFPTGTTKQTTYDKVLDDVVVITPKKDSKLYEQSGGNPIICPVLVLYHELDKSRNDELKFKINTGANIAGLLFGGFFIGTAEGITFYMNLLQVGSSTVNVTTGIFKDELTPVIGEAAVKNITAIATVIELSTSVFLIVKASPEMVSLLQPKAQEVLETVTQHPDVFRSLTGPSKLVAEEGINVSKSLLNMKTTTEVIHELPPGLQNVLSEIRENAKFVHAVDDEITIFSRVNGEITEIAKIESKATFKIVDSRITTGLSEQQIADLTQDMMDHPALLKVIGDDPKLAASWKELGSHPNRVNVEILEARKSFDDIGNGFTKTNPHTGYEMFDPNTGGYVVTHPGHNVTLGDAGSKAEFTIADSFSKSGKRVTLLDETGTLPGGRPDASIDGMGIFDFKNVDGSAINIESNIQKKILGIERQGESIAINIGDNINATVSRVNKGIEDAISTARNGELSLPKNISIIYPDGTNKTLKIIDFENGARF